MNYFPALLNIDYKKVVIVGGGHVARQKIESLIPTEALIVIVSPEVNDSIKQYLTLPNITWKQKHFEPSDLDDATLIFAVTDQEQVNDAVEEATQHWQLLSRADAKGRVDFINPAVVRRGDFVLTVSTSGASPGLTRKVKSELFEQFDDTYEQYVAYLKESRKQIIERFPDKVTKKRALDALLVPDVLNWIRASDFDACTLYLQNILTGEQSE